MILIPDNNNLNIDSNNLIKRKKKINQYINILINKLGLNINEYLKKKYNNFFNDDINKYIIDSNNKYFNDQGSNKEIEEINQNKINLNLNLLHILSNYNKLSPSPEVFYHLKVSPRFDSSTSKTKLLEFCSQLKKSPRHDSPTDESRIQKFFSESMMFKSPDDNEATKFLTSSFIKV